MSNHNQIQIPPMPFGVVKLCKIMWSWGVVTVFLVGLFTSYVWVQVQVFGNDVTIGAPDILPDPRGEWAPKRK